MSQRINCNIDDVLHARFKTLCADRQVQMSDVLRDLIQRYVDGSVNSAVTKGFRTAEKSPDDLLAEDAAMFFKQVRGAQ